MHENKQLDVIMDYKDTLNLPKTDFPMKGDGPKREPEIQKFWFENNIYKKVLEKRKKENKGSFLLHDGPPYLSSPNIHIGTALNKILKDIVVKYKTLRGYYSPYLPGFDCHGLPIESAVLKERGQRSEVRSQKSDLAVLEIRKLCTDFVLKNRKSQEEKFKRLGVLGDWENAYMTIDPKFEAQQLRLFGEMVSKGYIYRGLKPVYWCASCRTALAEAEVEYVENHKSPSIYVSFKVNKLSSDAKKLEKFNDLKVIIWTTTPWTLPGNLAICLNENFEYVVIKSEKFGHLLLAKELLKEFNSKISENNTALEYLKGKALENTICLHPLYERESPIILGEHVTLETGTGCVHTAPGHGLEDFTIGHKYGLEILSPVDAKGLFIEEAGQDLKGLYVHKAGNQKVIELLNKKGALIHNEDYYHSYPHCWRSKTPIIFRATKQWFCSVEKFRKQALEEIDKVEWVPPAGRNRIYSMVESRTDWCISRQRVWGVPIPAFYCSSCKENNEHLNKQIIDHVANIVERKGTDAWWELKTEELLLPNYKCSKCGGNSFTKETDTMDVWFDSGSTHFAVVDSKAELKDIDDVMYLEGSDQHRGWFQSSLLTSVALKEKAPYKTVLTHGFVLDETGRKMSKSLGNVVDPEKVINEYGADILRLWVASTDYSSDMRIGQTMLKQLAEVYRNIRNTARFILSNLYDFDPKKDVVEYKNLSNIDKYTLYNLEEVKEKLTQTFESNEFYKYYQILQNYCARGLSSYPVLQNDALRNPELAVRGLSNYYFDLSKDRLYTAGKKSLSRRSTQTVLYEILDFLVPVLCPVLPHLAEDIWNHLPSKFFKSVESSMFLCWPLIKPEFKNDEIAIEFANLNWLRDSILWKIEELRKEGQVGKSTEAKVHIFSKNEFWYRLERKYETEPKKELSLIFNVSKVVIHELNDDIKNYNFDPKRIMELANNWIIVDLSDGEKCPRCWKYSTDIGKDSKHKTICKPCADAVEGRD